MVTIGTQSKKQVQEEYKCFKYNSFLCMLLTIRKNMGDTTLADKVRD